MTKEEAEVETKHRLVKCVFSTLQKEGLIADDDLKALLIAAAEKYHRGVLDNLSMIVKICNKHY